MELALGRALADAGLTGADRVRAYDAAVELARAYARRIDAKGDSLHYVGGQFRDILIEIGLTPKARGDLVKAQPAASPLDELRDRRKAG